MAEGQNCLDQVVGNVVGRAADRVEIKVERFWNLEMAEKIDQQRIELETMPVARLARESQHRGG